MMLPSPMTLTSGSTAAEEGAAASGRTTTTASLMDEKDCEQQKHGLSERCDLWSFSSGPNVLASSMGPPRTRASRNRRIINGVSKATDWLPVQALTFGRALRPGSALEQGAWILRASVSSWEMGLQAVPTFSRGRRLLVKCLVDRQWPGHAEDVP